MREIGRLCQTKRLCQTNISLHPDDHTWSKCTDIRKSLFEDDNTQHVLYPRNLSGVKGPLYCALSRVAYCIETIANLAAMWRRLHPIWSLTSRTVTLLDNLLTVFRSPSSQAEISSNFVYQEKYNNYCPSF